MSPRLRRLLCWLGWHRHGEALHVVPVGRVGWHAEMFCPDCGQAWLEEWC